MRLILTVSVVLFVVLGTVLIPYAGIQADEAIFAEPLYQPFNPDYGITVFHHQFTLMVFPYTGALKTLLYWPILRTFGPGAYSIRIPVVLAGAAAILLFYLLAAEIAGSRAALIGSLLLATDPSFLITNTFDWGPVALEHVLLLGGCLMIVSRRPVFGMFLFGLALWNKAIFIWAISGLIMGMVAACLPELRRHLADRRLVLRGACAFLAGALPLIVYNIHVPYATFGPNAHFVPAAFPGKLVQLEHTLNGSDLFGYLAAEDSSGQPKPPRSFPARVSRFIEALVGVHQTSLFASAVLLAVFAAPLWWHSSGRSAALFALTFSAASFLFMALTGNGGSAHHIVLLWPMPQLLVGVAVAILRPKWLMVGCATALVAANLLVVNQYLAQFDRNGAAGAFSDALYPLSDSLSDSASTPLYVVDWGIIDNLNLLHRDKLNVRPFDGNFDPGFEYLSRVRESEQLRGVGDRLAAAAQAAGYEKFVSRTISDSNGRPVFEIFHFHRTAAP